VSDRTARWFSALLVLEATHADEPAVQSLFEQSIVLVRRDGGRGEDQGRRASRRGRMWELNMAGSRRSSR